MTGNNVLLDTNIIIELFKGDAGILRRLEDSKTINIPFAVLGELLFGAYRSSNREKHLLQIRKFLSGCTVLQADTETANEYALVKSALAEKGKPIPENDIWIAALAKKSNLLLITRDKHFQEVDGLVIENWL